jgi:oxalate decarboxylase
MIPIEKVSLPQASATSPFTANIHNITPKNFEGGFTVPLTSQDISALNGIGFSYLQGKPGSLREPHWHPNAAELIYIIQGSAQGAVIASDKVHQTFTAQSGDVSFVPTNWLHYLNITSNDPLIMITFFSNSSPTRIDFSQMMENFPRPLLAASLGPNLEIFQKVPELSGDLFLISKNIV